MKQLDDGNKINMCTTAYRFIQKDKRTVGYVYNDTFFLNNPADDYITGLASLILGKQLLSVKKYCVFRQNCILKCKKI